MLALTNWPSSFFLLLFVFAEIWVCCRSVGRRSPTKNYGSTTALQTFHISVWTRALSEFTIVLHCSPSSPKSCNNAHSLCINLAFQIVADSSTIYEKETLANKLVDKDANICLVTSNHDQLMRFIISRPVIPQHHCNATHY